MATDNQSESQETNSTSLVEESVNITFEDICYKVRHGFLAGGQKNILNAISGQFNAGELSVIVGQSGAGKSSLMDILAGYTSQQRNRNSSDTSVPPRHEGILIETNTNAQKFASRNLTPSSTSTAESLIVEKENSEEIEVPELNGRTYLNSYLP